jgi:hypothetical protein
MVREAQQSEFRTQINQDVAAGVASTVDDFMVRVDRSDPYIPLSDLRGDKLG